MNAIRTSHNPPAPELLDLCDRLGLLVKDEAFDEFTPAKNKWVDRPECRARPAASAMRRISPSGRCATSKTWSAATATIPRLHVEHRQRDRLPQRSVLRSRRSVSDYQPRESAGAAIMVEPARPLIEAVKRLDPTRPVTAGAGQRGDVRRRRAGGTAGRRRLQLPGVALCGRSREVSRIGSSSAVRPDTGVNQLDRGPRQRVRGAASSSGRASITWARRAGFRIAPTAPGLLDLCGFKKPLAWFRQSLWSDEPMVYLARLRRRRLGVARGGVRRRRRRPGTGRRARR